MTMRLTPVVLAVAVTASACTHAVRPSAQVSSEGTYEFNERVAGSDRTLRGTVRVERDTAIVDVETDLCVYVASASKGRNFMTYSCGDVAYTVDRSSSDLRVLYSFSNIVTRQRTVCAQYSTNAQGQQVCTRTAVEAVEQRVPVRGQLHPRLADE
jgi:hypothetical protein